MHYHYTKRGAISIGQLLLSTFLLTFVFLGRAAQENPTTSFIVSGYIVEEGSGEQLLGVTVYDPISDTGTISNSYGFFSLKLTTGEHKLIVSHLGYLQKEMQINVDDNLELNISLSLKTESLDEVVVTSEGIKESKVTQMSKLTLKPNDVKDLPALLGETDVLKTLQLLPGIQGGTEGSSGFFVRGGTPDQNLIILDDAVVYNSNHLFGFFSVFNGDAIKSVEAFKGGFPARFGGRLSSVVKIDMKDGNKEEIHGKLNVGLISSSIVLEGPIKKEKTSFILSARRTYADALARPFQNISVDGIAGYHFGDLNLKFHHIINTKNKIYWSNYLGQDRFKYDFRDDFTRERTRLGWGNITSSLRWNHQFNNKLFANTALVYSGYQFRITDEFEDSFNGTTSQSSFDTSSGINDFSLKTDFEFYPNTKHSFRFGAGTTLHNFTPQRVSSRDSFITDDINREQVLNSLESAIYLEDDWRISDKFRFAPGFRLSHFNFENTNYLNPELRLGISYQLQPDLALKASYSNMNQYIHLLSSSGIGLPTDLWVSSTDEVRPQRSQQVALGLAKDFLNKSYSFTIEGYYKKLDDVIAYREGASFLVLDDLESGAELNWEEDITAGQGWAYGAEFLLRKQKGNFTGWLGYTLAWSERQFDELNLGRKFFDRYDRRHDISVVGIYKPSNRFTFSGSWVFNTGSNFTLPNLQGLRLDNAPVRNSNFFNFFENEEFTTSRNNFRGESSHRLDLSVQFHKKRKNGSTRTWGFSLYNAYARQNPFIYTLDESDFDFNDPNATVQNELSRTSILIAIPSVNYSIKF